MYIYIHKNMINTFMLNTIYNRFFPYNKALHQWTINTPSAPPPVNSSLFLLSPFAFYSLLTYVSVINDLSKQFPPSNSSLFLFAVHSFSLLIHYRPMFLERFILGFLFALLENLLGAFEFGSIRFALELILACRRLVVAALCVET